MVARQTSPSGRPTLCRSSPTAKKDKLKAEYEAHFNPPTPTAAERVKLVAEFEAGEIEAMLHNGTSSLGVAQIVHDAGFTSDAARRFVAQMGVGAYGGLPLRPQPMPQLPKPM